MKKIFIILFTVTIIMGALNYPTEAKAIKKKDVICTRFYDYYVDNNNLMSDRIESIKINVDRLFVDNNTIDFFGNIENIGDFRILTNMESDNTYITKELTGNYNLIASQYLNNKLRIILTYNDDMIFIDIMDDGRELEEFVYNQFWYSDFLSGEVVESESMISPSAVTTYEIVVHSRVYYIYGDQYQEIIELIYNYIYPDTISARGSLYEIATSVAIRAKYTHVSEFQGQTYTVQNCSLFASSAACAFAVDQGQFLDSVELREQCTVYPKSIFSIDFSIGIPKTPFSISYNLDNRVAAKYKDFASLGKGVQGLAMWESGEHLTKVGDYYKVYIKMATDLGNVKYGTVRLATEWGTFINSSGSGVSGAAPAYFDKVTKVKSLNYTVAQ